MLLYYQEGKRVLMKYQDKKNDVLDALNDIYSDLKEASMNFQTHYGMILPFNVPHVCDAADAYSCIYVYACICITNILTT